MARLKVGIYNLNTIELYEKGLLVHQKLVDNATLFPAPPVSLVSFQSALAALFDSYEEAKNVRDMIPTRKQNEAIVRDMINRLAGYVSGVAGGDPVKFVMGGFSEINPQDPIGPLDAVENFKVSVKQDFPGKLFLTWRKRRGASSYNVYMSANQTDYEQIATVQQSRFTVSDLQPGTTYYFRCVPIGPLGPGHSCTEDIRKYSKSNLWIENRMRDYHHAV